MLSVQFWPAWLWANMKIMQDAWYLFLLWTFSVASIKLAFLFLSRKNDILGRWHGVWIRNGNRKRVQGEMKYYGPRSSAKTKIQSRPRSLWARVLQDDGSSAREEDWSKQQSEMEMDCAGKEEREKRRVLWLGQLIDLLASV